MEKGNKRRGLKINREKTVYPRFNGDGNLDGNLDGVIWKQITLTTFKYLGSTLKKNGDSDAKMTHRIRSRWINWNMVSGILCN